MKIINWETGTDTAKVSLTKDEVNMLIDDFESLRVGEESPSYLILKEETRKETEQMFARLS